jgi:hypothetical protein
VVFPGTSEKFCTPERYRLCQAMGVSTRNNRRLVRGAPPGDAAMAAVPQRISRRVVRTRRRLGSLEAGMDAAVATAEDPRLVHAPGLARTMAASVTRRLAFGGRAGAQVRRIGPGVGHAGARPALTGPRGARVPGVSLHANAGIPAPRREPVARVMRDTARGAVSLERLAEGDDGDLVYLFTRPRSE